MKDILFVRFFEKNEWSVKFLSNSSLTLCETPPPLTSGTPGGSHTSDIICGTPGGSHTYKKHRGDPMVSARVRPLGGSTNNVWIVRPLGGSTCERRGRVSHRVSEELHKMKAANFYLSTSILGTVSCWTREHLAVLEAWSLSSKACSSGGFFFDTLINHSVSR